MDLSLIFQYFNRFGEIVHRDLGRGPHGDIGIVEFKYTENAQAILMKKYHRIGKYILRIDGMATNNYGASQRFLGVNQTQWMQILDNLDIVDLCAVTETCQTLKRFAEQAFKAKFDKITWRANSPYSAKAFHLFGHLITHLDVDIVEPKNLSKVIDICGTKLRHLSLWMAKCSSPLNPIYEVKLKLIFAQLQCLEIYSQKFFDTFTAIELFKSCSALESLSINCTTDCDPVWNRINVHFARLTELKLHFNAAINDVGLECVLASNPGITNLYIDECTRLSSKAIHIIVRYLPGLEELTLGLLQNSSPKELKHFGELKRLKAFRILLNPALPLLNVICETGMPIECLDLWHVDVTRAHIELISRIKSIKELTIYSYSVDDDHLKLLAINLPMLTELRLAHSKMVTIDGLKDLLFSANNLSYLHLTNVERLSQADECHLEDFSEQLQRNKPLIIIDYL